MAWHETDHFRSLRGFSDRCASLFNWATPNLITLASLLLTAPMILAFAKGRIALGAVFFALSSIGDFLDGALARWQHDRMSDLERARERKKFFLFQRGQSEGGLNLDPFTDKVRYFGALLPLGWPFLSHPLIAASLAFASGLTIGRPIIKWWKTRRATLPPETIGKANRFGKLKAYAEIVMVAYLVICHSDMPFALIQFVGNCMLGIAALGGAASLAGQLYTALKPKKTSS